MGLHQWYIFFSPSFPKSAQGYGREGTKQHMLFSYLKSLDILLRIISRHIGR